MPFLKSAASLYTGFTGVTAIFPEAQNCFYIHPEDRKEPNVLSKNRNY